MEDIYGKETVFKTIPHSCRNNCYLEHTGAAGLEVETWHIVALYLGLLLGLVIKPFSEPIITLIIVGIAACSWIHPSC